VSIDEPTPLVPVSANQLRSARRLSRRKERAASGLFLAEGPQAVREALRLPDRVILLLVDGTAAARHAPLVDRAGAAGIPARSASTADLSGLTDTVTPQGVVAICRRLDVPVEQILSAAPPLLVCCAQVRDPGNAGTVIRCADAFGAGAVLLSTGSVDPYNPKCVRASAGSIFHLPLALGADLAGTADLARRYGYQVLAADGDGEVELPALAASGALAQPTLWVLGNEAWGLPAADRTVADRVVTVPIHGAAESLNLAAAAAVCLYATATAQHPLPGSDQDRRE
jgi:RNA methyltransferase, TrmH family